MLRHALLAALALAYFTAPALAESPIQFRLDQAGVAWREPSLSREARETRLRDARDRVTLEVAGSPAIPDLVREAFHWLGSGNMTGKPGAWCAWAISFWLERTGRRPLANGLAAAALSYGPRLPGPRVGALAVLANGHGRITHVGLVAAVRGDAVEMISGNWGHRVARAVLPSRAFLAFIGV
jgi:hypothetical protein